MLSRSGFARPAPVDRDHLELFAEATLERKLVDVPATAPFGVEQLMVDEQEAEIDRLAQFWPTLVRIIRGIADSETTRMTTR